MGTLAISLFGLLDRFLPETPVKCGPVLLMRQSVAQREREHQGTMAMAMGALRQRNTTPSPAPQASGHEAPRGADRGALGPGLVKDLPDLAGVAPNEPATPALFGEGRP